MASFIGFICIMILNIFQLCAINAGLTDWLGFHWAAALFTMAVLMLLRLPPGTGILAIFGAMNAWNWPWFYAVALMWGPIIFLMLVGAFVFGWEKASVVVFKKKRWPRSF